MCESPFIVSDLRRLIAALQWKVPCVVNRPTALVKDSRRRPTRVSFGLLEVAVDSHIDVYERLRLLICGWRRIQLQERT